MAIEKIFDCFYVIKKLENIYMAYTYIISYISMTCKCHKQLQKETIDFIQNSVANQWYGKMYGKKCFTKSLRN